MWGPPQIRFFAYYMGGGGGLRSVSSLTIGDPSDQFIRILYGPPLRSISSLAICGGPLRFVFSPTVWAHPPVSFFAYYMPPPPPDQFLCLLCGGPFRSVSLHIYYIGGPLRSVSSLTIGGPLSSVSSHNTSIWGPPQINFFAYYMGAPWINFFDFYMGAP